MHKVHITVLYLGLALATAALVIMWFTYTEQQSRIASLEERQQALDGGLNGLDAWVEYLHETQQGMQQEVNALVDWSEEVTDWQNETAAWSEGIAKWQADVTVYMNRTGQQGVPAGWEAWRTSVDRRVANVQGSVSDNQVNIPNLYTWSDEIAAYLDSGQQPGTVDTNQILFDFIRAYNGDPLAIARLPQHLVTLSGG